MEFKRRSTFRDKVISILATFLSVLFMMSAFELWKRTGNLELLDIAAGVIAFITATVFTNIKKFTYMKFEGNNLIWYRCIFFKKLISGKKIKKIKAKMNHVILITDKDKEVWIPMAFLRPEDGQAVIEKIKVL